MYKVSRPLVLFCALLAGAGTPAWAESPPLWQQARNTLSNLQSGKSPKSLPVSADGAVETWGDAMPARGLQAAEKRLAASSQGRDPAASEAPRGAAQRSTPELRREQQADERALDDRFRDERKAATRKRTDEGDEQEEPSRARTKSVKGAQAVAVGAQSRASRRNPEDRYFEGREEIHADSAKTRAAGSCENVSRAWEGAAALAERGEEKRAYDAYLRLFSSCNSEKELVGTVFQAQKHLSPESLAELMQEPVMESPKLLSAMMTLKLQRMFAANKSKDGRVALGLSREIRAKVLESSDLGALEVSGWLEQRAKNPKAAEALFRRALKVDRDAEGPRQGLVYALLAQNKVDAAAREAERFEGADGDALRAEVLLAQARVDLKAEQYADTLKKLDRAEKLGLEVDDSVLETRAWALKAVGDTERAARLFAALVKADPGNPDLEAGLVDSLFVNRDTKSLQRLSTDQGTLGDAAREAVARTLDTQGRRLEAGRLRKEVVEGEDGGMGGAIGVRMKSGEQGAGRLTETTAPTLNVSKRIGDSTVIAAEGKKIDMNDGVNTSRGGEVRLRMTTTLSDVEVTAGAGVSRTGGSTKATFEGKVKVYTQNGHLEAGLSREPVRDSVRSYSGTDVEVPVEGGGSKTLRVGRVVDTNAYVAGSTMLDHLNRYNLAWSVGAGSVSGENSYNNGYYRASAQITKEIQDDRFGWLNIGPYINVQSFENDENRFKGGYGGYFSPKSDIGMGLVGNLMTKEGNRNLFKASAQMGYVSRGLYYGNDSGISVESTVEGAWLLNSHLILGAGAQLRTSPGYTDVGFRVGLQVPFEPRTKLNSADLKPFKVQ